MTVLELTMRLSLLDDPSAKVFIEIFHDSTAAQ